MNKIGLSAILWAAWVVASFTAPVSAFSQVAPEAHHGSPSFSIGAAASDFDVDWAQNRMEGFTIWGQWHPRPRGLLSGLGVDAEFRDIAFGRSYPLPSNFKQTTFAGGPIYTLRIFHDFQPYGKFLFGFGSSDFQIGDNSVYTHDTRAIYAPGGGFEYRLMRRLWVRADYEYQFWPDLFTGAKTLDPQGFTLGFSYDLKPGWR